jgi:signal transduction histidine kinase
MEGGLIRRVLVASALLALIIASGFAVLLTAVIDQDRLQRDARQSGNALIAANHLERDIIDMESGQRGYLLTGQAEYLQPWQTARKRLPSDEATLLRMVEGMSPQQMARARTVTQGASSYLNDYAVPLVKAAQKDRAAVNVVTATAQGRQRVGTLMTEFDQLTATENHMAAVREQQSATAENHAVWGAIAGLAGSVAVVALFAAYMARRIVRPVRRVALMASRLAGGDLTARLPEQDGSGEIAALQGSFNTMAGALEEKSLALVASRRRIVTAFDNARRRIERDLHDGVQQRLVSLALELRAVEALAPPEAPQLKERLCAIAQGLGAAHDELRELSRGIHPAILSEGGLGPALKGLARRSTIPVELDVEVPDRLPELVEVAAYFVVSESLANAAKYANASVIQVGARVVGEQLHLTVRDDGVGGADASRGTGLTGLTDRVHALGGTLEVTGPVGQGTTLQAELPTTVSR